MDLEELDALDQRLASAVQDFPTVAQKALLRYLTSSREHRGELIQRVHRGGKHPRLVDMLVDLEVSPVARQLLELELGVALRLGRASGGDRRHP